MKTRELSMDEEHAFVKVREDGKSVRAIAQARKSITSEECKNLAKICQWVTALVQLSLLNIKSSLPQCILSLSVPIFLLN